MRTLRSKVNKALLLKAYRNRCAICGCSLEGKTVHFDHIVPWSKGGRTTFDNLQPVCAPCNLQKGCSMKIEEEMRDGQLKAMVKIEEIVVSEVKPTGSIVLPTRYGKSDVIRMSSIITRDHGVICGSIILCTEVVLVEQMCDPDKLRDMFDRYEVLGRGRLTFRAIEESNEEGELFPNEEVAICMTVHRALHDKDLLCRIREAVRLSKKRVLVHIDEGHMYAAKKPWGEFVNELVEVGCVVFLHTATPWRTDADCIPGFEWTSAARQEKTTHVPRAPKSPKELLEGKRVIDTYETVQEKIRLVADHETTFAEAYEEGALCRLQWDKLEVEMTFVSANQDDFRWVRDLSANEVKKNYRRILTNNETVERGVLMLIDALDSMPDDAQAIVFSATDRGDEGESSDHRYDFHANQIKAMIKLFTDRRTVVITGNSENKDDQLDDFLDGKYDIAIFKNMGGRGLDVERVKVVADFSPVRTPASLVQRIMRAATPWEYVPGKFIRHCRVVLLHDIRAEEIWRQRIREVGGDYDDWMTTCSTLVDSKPVKEPEDEDPIRSDVNQAVKGDSEFSTGEHVAADSEFIEEARKIAKFLPEQSAESIAVAMAKASAVGETDEPREGSERVVDIGAELESVRKMVNPLAQRYGAIMTEKTGSECRTDKEKHFSYANRTMKAAAGITDRAVKLKHVKTKAKLEVMVAYGEELVEKALSS